MKLKLILTLCFYLLMLSPVIHNCYGQSQLSSLCQIADTSNIQLRKIRIQKLYNKEEKKSYLSARFPQLNFNADYKYNAKIPGQVVPAAFFGGQPGTYATVQFGVPYVLSNNLQLSQILFNSQLNYGLAALKINQEITQIQENLTSQEIKYQIATNFMLYQSLLLQEKFIDSLIIVSKNLKNNIQQLIIQNLKTPIEKKPLDLVIKELELGKKTIQNNLMVLKEYMLILIGMENTSELDIDFDESIFNSFTTIQNKESYYTLDLIKSQINMIKEEKKGIKMAYLPSINAYGIYNYSYNLKPDDDFRKGIDGAFIGLRADWNLFDGLQKKNKYKMAQLKESQLENDLSFTQKQLEMSKLDAKLKIDLAKQKLSLMEEKQALNRELYEFNVQKYNQYVLGSSELMKSLNEYIQSKNQTIEALYELRIRELEFLKLIGDLNF